MGEIRSEGSRSSLASRWVRKKIRVLEMVRRLSRVRSAERNRAAKILRVLEMVLRLSRVRSAARNLAAKILRVFGDLDNERRSSRGFTCIGCLYRLLLKDGEVTRIELTTSTEARNIWITDDTSSAVRMVVDIHYLGFSFLFNMFKIYMYHQYSPFHPS